MAEISKLDLNSDSLNHSREMSELQQMGKQQILVSDHRNVKSDSFVVNLEGFSNGVDKDSTTNSRITLQRSLSRKSQANGRDAHVCSSSSSSSSSSLPRTALAVAGDTPEKPASPLPGMATIGAIDNSINMLPQHQITIKTAGIGAMGEARWGKRHGIRRSPPSWFYNPKKILFLFATLSSVGTMLLIFFTLSMSRPTEST
ncbi:hypothetical protein Nepgr_007180 [Nepenthes gracilis]|uniref:Uncharacterized protein n=1 Tax=Nepenthes gracilis TaxID=150966 RepID=A0AAD3XI46_NEPGR|nr:hypothetical protein Nepgr_007180 [Nepenthes gracilis]